MSYRFAGLIDRGVRNHQLRQSLDWCEPVVVVQICADFFPIGFFLEEADKFLLGFHPVERILELVVI